jgi:uncharacterized membrane-anchored protein
MSYMLDRQRQTSQVGVQRGDVNPALDSATWVMPAIVILRLSVFAILLLIGVLAYAVVNTAVRGLILLFAVGTLVFGLLLYHVIRMTAYTTASGRGLSWR